MDTESPAEKEYKEFMAKVKRTVFIDNLSHQVTVPVIKTALGQFGSVLSVQFVPTYEESKNIPQCALVEMQDAKEAKAIISEMTNYPFMMSGMPRPVRGFAAEPEMFMDRPVKPGRKIQCKWMDPKDQDFQIAQKLKHITRKHRAEASLLLKKQLEEEEKLAKQQAETLKANYKKFEMIDKLWADGTIRRLGNRFNVDLREE